MPTSAWCWTGARSGPSALPTAFGADVVSDLDALMERCDAVWICTPTVAHRNAVDAALAHGRAVFCEKPLATDLDGAHALVAAVAASPEPVLAQCGLVLRSAPVFRALRELVASGTLGRPMAAIFRDDQYFPIQGTYASQWRADVTQAGGGCLIEHSIHDVDILRFCFGEVDRLSARTANFSGHEGIEDLATVSLSFASGLEAHLTSVWHNILSRGSTRRIELFCRRAWSGWTTSSGDRCTSRRVTAPRSAPARRRAGSTSCRSAMTRSAWRFGPMWRRIGPSSKPLWTAAPPIPVWTRRLDGPPARRCRLPSRPRGAATADRRGAEPEQVRSSRRSRGSGSGSRSRAWRRAARPWATPAASPTSRPCRRRRWSPTR